MSAENDEKWPCPKCGTPMLDGYLTDPADTIRIQTMQSFEGSSLQARVCPNCGFVELWADTPDLLRREDISDEELGNSQ